MSLFNFELLPVDDIEPWGKAADGVGSLSWYALSLGWYWIDLGDGVELFRYTDAIQEVWACDYPQAQPVLPYDDYQVAMLMTTLQDGFHKFINPVPAELAARVADADAWGAWIKRAEDWNAVSDDDDDLQELALRWWRDRRLDASYLRHPPNIRLWAVGDTMHIRWDNRTIVDEATGIAIWTAAAGERTMAVSTFTHETKRFCERLLSAMWERIAWLEHEPQTRATVRIAELWQQHERRLDQHRCAFDLDYPHKMVADTEDWTEIAGAIAEIDRRLPNSV